MWSAYVGEISAPSIDDGVGSADYIACWVVSLSALAVLNASPSADGLPYP